jgi:hypothetical protein
MSTYTPIETELKNIKLDIISLQVDALSLHERLIELRDYADMKGERVAWFDDIDWNIIDRALHTEFYDVNRFIRYIIKIFDELNLDPFIKIENK